MKKTIFGLFFLACFLCSWGLRAAHEDKREVNLPLIRVSSFSEEEEKRAEPKEEGAEGGGAAASALSKKGARDFLLVLPESTQVVSIFNPETMKGILRLSLNPLPVGFEEFNRTLALRQVAVDGSVISFVEDLRRRLSAFNRLEIYQSDLNNSMLLFLGLALPKLPLTQIMFEKATLCILGFKYLFAGLMEMPGLESFSWRHMTYNGYHPWWIEALPRWPSLRHLDLGGSIALKEEEGSMKAVENLFLLLPNIIRLESLGLSHARLSRYFAQLLSRALEKLAHNQMLHSEDRGATRLRTLDLEGALAHAEEIKSLQPGLKGAHYIEHLNLANNQITDLDLRHLLSNILAHMKKLVVLNLSGNLLTDESLKSVEELIEQNTHLQKLILSGNTITPGKLKKFKKTGVEIVID